MNIANHLADLRNQKTREALVAASSVHTTTCDGDWGERVEPARGELQLNVVVDERNGIEWLAAETAEL